MRDLLRGTIILSSANLSVRVLGHIYRILMGRMLSSTYEFGLLNLALPIQYFILTVTSSGIAPSVAKFVAERRQKIESAGRSETISSALVYFALIGFFLGSILYLLSPLLGLYFFKDANVISPLRISSLAMGFGFAVAVFTGTFQGYKRMEYMGGTLVAEQLLRIIFAFALVYLGLGVIGAILGSTLGFAAAVLVAYLFFRRLGLRFSNHSLKSFEEVFLFSLPVSATAIAAFVLATADIFLLGFYFSPIEVGIYSAASPTARLILAFTTALYASALPSVSELRAKRSGGEIRKYALSAYKLAFAVLIPVIAVSLLLSREIIALLFGPTYIAAAEPFRILVIGSALFGIFSINSGIFQGLGMPSIPLRILGFASILDIFLNATLIPRYQIQGAAYATTISHAFAGISSALVLWRTLWKYTSRK